MGLEVHTETTVKKKKHSKNKKKTWRKHTDISDVEELLTDQRREERYGGHLEEQKEDEFMFVDVGDDEITSPKDDANQNETPNVGFVVDTRPGRFVTPTQVSLKQSSKKQKQKQLKCHEFLKGLPGAKVPIKPRHSQGEEARAEQESIKRFEVEKRKQHKYQKQLVNMTAAYAKTKERRNNRNKFNKDVWNDKVDAVTKSALRKGIEKGFAEEIATHFKIQTKIQPVKVPGSIRQKTSLIPAVPLPQGGLSYNPSSKDHEDLVRDTKMGMKHYQKMKDQLEPVILSKTQLRNRNRFSQKMFMSEMTEGMAKGATSLTKGVRVDIADVKTDEDEGGEEALLSHMKKDLVKEEDVDLSDLIKDDKDAIDVKEETDDDDDDGENLDQSVTELVEIKQEPEDDEGMEYTIDEVEEIKEEVDGAVTDDDLIEIKEEDNDDDATNKTVKAKRNRKKKNKSKQQSVNNESKPAQNNKQTKQNKSPKRANNASNNEESTPKKQKTKQIKKIKIEKSEDVLKDEVQGTEGKSLEVIEPAKNKKNAKKTIQQNAKKAADEEKELDRKSHAKKVRAMMREKRAKLKLKGKLPVKSRDKTCRLGKAKFMDKPVRILKAKQLTGCLRQVQTAGNVFNERFNHLQRRNILPASYMSKVERPRKLRRLVMKKSHQSGPITFSAKEFNKM